MTPQFCSITPQKKSPGKCSQYKDEMKGQNHSHKLLGYQSCLPDAFFLNTNISVLNIQCSLLIWPQCDLLLPKLIFLKGSHSESLREIQNHKNPERTVGKLFQAVFPGMLEMVEFVEAREWLLCRRHSLNVSSNTQHILPYDSAIQNIQVPTDLYQQKKGC